HSPAVAPPIGSLCIAPLHLPRHDRGAAAWHRDGPIRMSKGSSALRLYVAMSQSPLAWLQSRRLTRRCSDRWTHKVLGRGRAGVLLEQVRRARVLIGRRAVAELSS